MKDYTVLLTIPKIPKTKKGRGELVKWLRRVATEINNSDPKIFATPCKFRLMK